MAIFDEEALKKNIKSGAFSRIYFLFGNESYLKKYYTDLIIKKTVSADFKDFNLHILEGKDTDLNEISDCVLSFPMMDEYSCTVVNDYPLLNILGDKGKINESFSQLISELPESTVLVFRAENTEVDIKNAKWTKIIKFFESKEGVCANLCKRTQYQLSKLLEDSAKKKNCTLSREVSAYMVSVIGDDLSTLKNELDKICAYKNGGVIEKQDVDNTAVVSAEAKIFNLSRQITSGNADEALKTLTNLFKNREEPVVISAVLSKAFVDMYRVKTAKEKGIKSKELAEIFPSAYKGREFILQNADRDGAGYTVERIHKSLELLSETDTRLKSTGENPQAVLEELVLRLLRV